MCTSHFYEEKKEETLHKTNVYKNSNWDKIQITPNNTKRKSYTIVRPLRLASLSRHSGITIIIRNQLKRILPFILLVFILYGFIRVFRNKKLLYSFQLFVFIDIQFGSNVFNDSLQIFAWWRDWKTIHKVHSTSELFEVRKFICGKYLTFIMTEWIFIIDSIHHTDLLWIVALPALSAEHYLWWQSQQPVSQCRPDLVPQPHKPLQSPDVP